MTQNAKEIARGERFAFGANRARFFNILVNQSYPIRFVLSRLLRYSGLWRLFKIKREGYQLHFQPASISLALWVEPESREADSHVLRAILRPGDVYIDVGANIGHLAIEASLLVGEQGKVIAFEAHPKTAYFLRQNVNLNRRSNINVAQLAVGEAIGWVSFSDIRSDDQNRVIGAGGIYVPVVPLDVICVNESPTLLKIDVEGFELFVLRGAKSLLSRTKFVYLEAYDKHFDEYSCQFRDVYDLLCEMGFQVVRFADGSLKRVSRESTFPHCVNLLAYRDESELFLRTGWHWRWVAGEGQGG